MMNRTFLFAAVAALMAACQSKDELTPEEVKAALISKYGRSHYTDISRVDPESVKQFMDQKAEQEGLYLVNRHPTYSDLLAHKPLLQLTDKGEQYKLATNDLDSTRVRLKIADMAVSDMTILPESDAEGKVASVDYKVIFTNPTPFGFLDTTKSEMRKARFEFAEGKWQLKRR